MAHRLLNESGNREGIGPCNHPVRRYSRRTESGIAIHSSADFNK